MDMRLKHNLRNCSKMHDTFFMLLTKGSSFQMNLVGQALSYFTMQTLRSFEFLWQQCRTNGLLYCIKFPSCDSGFIWLSHGVKDLDYVFSSMGDSFFRMQELPKESMPCIAPMRTMAFSLGAKILQKVDIVKCDSTLAISRHGIIPLMQGGFSWPTKKQLPKMLTR